MSEQHDILTPAEAAKLLRLSESQLHELCRSRTRVAHGSRAIPRLYIGRHLRFQRTALLDWINQLAKVA